jgi:membrane fusion protein (multidrug efflux system)
MINHCRCKIYSVITCLLVCAAVHAAEDVEEAGSVLIQTQVPKRGSLPDDVVAYGLAAPALNGTMTLSVPAEGRVMSIAVTAGEAVRAGQSLLEFHLAPAASSRYSQALSALKLAREEQVTTARLLSQQLATRDQLAQAAKAVSDAEVSLAALEAEQGGEVSQIVKAPFNGVVGALPVAQGERVAAGAPLVTVTRDGGLVITAGVEATLRRKVRIGDAVSLVPLADAESATQGTVARIDRVINPKTRLVDVDIKPQEPNSIDLLEGAAFRATIQTGEIQGWIVPRDAVLSDNVGEYVFQVADGKAVRVSVKRLGGDDDQSIVDGALDPKRPLVTLGNYQLNDGAAVRTKDDHPEPAGK